jgi:hypothetical protein
MKLKLKNERAVITSLELEEVMSHNLIDFFSTAMIV